MRPIQYNVGCVSIIDEDQYPKYSIVYYNQKTWNMPFQKLTFQLPMIISIFDSSRKLVFFGRDRELINNSCCYCTSEDGWNTSFLESSPIVLYIHIQLQYIYCIYIYILYTNYSRSHLFSPILSISMMLTCIEYPQPRSNAIFRPLSPGPSPTRRRGTLGKRRYRARSKYLDPGTVETHKTTRKNTPACGKSWVLIFE